jgi:hypothetical protein
MPDHVTLPRSLDIVRAEYLEIPGWHLTQAPMQRLWEFDPRTCGLVVDALITANVLKRANRDRSVLARTAK